MVDGKSRFSLWTRWRHHTDVRGLYKAVYEDPFYSPGHDKFADDPWGGMLVKTDLNAVLENVYAAMNHELDLAIDSHLGTDTKAWKDIDLMPTISTRQSPTPSTSQNKEYLAGSSGASPKLLRPILGRLGGIAARRQIKYPEEYLELMYRERMKIPEEEAANLGMETLAVHLQRMLRFDSDAEFHAVSTLRDEAARTIGDDTTCTWNKSKVAAMTLADSVAHEIALPKGSTVSFVAYYAQTDVENPLKYDPFRFSRACAAEMDEQVSRNLSFSHEKHSCPGRFLVDFELKMVIAYVLVNYDIEFPPEYKGNGPQNHWLADAIFPPENVRMKIRRKEHTG
ncbi:cytochrome P450 [Ustulina deusta]|nr:cytochrome P450 [Ustulina deusta]